VYDKTIKVKIHEKDEEAQSPLPSRLALNDMPGAIEGVWAHGREGNTWAFSVRGWNREKWRCGKVVVLC